MKVRYLALLASDAETDELREEIELVLSDTSEDLAAEPVVHVNFAREYGAENRRLVTIECSADEIVDESVPEALAAVEAVIGGRDNQHHVVKLYDSRTQERNDANKHLGNQNRIDRQIDSGPQNDSERASKRESKQYKPTRKKRR